jgi:hypothetical protein
VNHPSLCPAYARQSLTPSWLTTGSGDADKLKERLKCSEEKLKTPENK